MILPLAMKRAIRASSFYLSVERRFPVRFFDVLYTHDTQKYIYVFEYYVHILNVL